MNDQADHTLSFVRADQAHCAVMAALHAECFPEAPWDETAMGKLLALPGAAAVIACCGEQPVGLLFWQQLVDEAEILTLGVRPDWRHRGVARALMREATSLLRDQGVTLLHLEVAEDNEAAIAFYRGVGFSNTGRRPKYYSRTGGIFVDAVTMVFRIT